MGRTTSNGVRGKTCLDEMEHWQRKAREYESPESLQTHCEQRWHAEMRDVRLLNDELQRREDLLTKEASQCCYLTLKPCKHNVFLK